MIHLHSLYLFHDWLGASSRSARTFPTSCVRTALIRTSERHRPRKGLVEVLFQTRVRTPPRRSPTHDLEREISGPYAGTVPRASCRSACRSPASRIAFRRGRSRQFPATAVKRIVLFLSRLHEKKGLDLLVPAFAAAQRVAPDLHRYRGPDDGVLARTRERVAAHGLDAAVTFTGMLIGEDKLQPCRRSMLCCRPTARISASQSSRRWPPDCR